MGDRVYGICLCASYCSDGLGGGMMEKILDGIMIFLLIVTCFLLFR